MNNLRNCISNCIKLCRVKSPVIHRLIEYRQFNAIARANTFNISRENVFAHGILESNEKCHVLRGEQNIESNVKCEDIDLNQNWSNLTADDILQHLRMIGGYCTTNAIMISDERFDTFVGVCTERCFDFTDQQLVKSLQILIHYPQTTNYRLRNFFELWRALDDACVERINKWNFDKVLYICDHWYMLNLGRWCTFNIKASLTIGTKLRTLPPHQLLQLMFYHSMNRAALLDMIEVENNLIKYINELSLKEMAIVSMGFFKTGSKMYTEDLITNLYKRLISEIDTVHDISFTCILKILRSSSKSEHTGLIKKLFNAADGQVPRLSLAACLHLAIFGSRVRFCHQNCIEQIVRRFSKDVKSLRLKDCERISFVMSVFDFQTQDQIENQLCQQILDDLKNRTDEIKEFPHCFIKCLNYLSMKGYYDEELINIALSKKFLKSCYGPQLRDGNNFFSLDCYTKINLKETYRGNELTEKNRQYLGKMMAHLIPIRGKFKPFANDKLLLDIKETAEGLCNHCYFAHALPHFPTPDVIIAYDKRTKTGIDIANNFPELYTGKIIDRSMLIKGLNINPSDVEIINIIAAGRNFFMIDTYKYTGLLKQKLEQSKILGFKSVLVSWQEWARLQEGDRNHFLKYKITSAWQKK